MATQLSTEWDKRDAERDAEALRLGMPLPPKVRVVEQGASLRLWSGRKGRTL